MTKTQKKRLLNIAKRDCFCAGDNKVGNFTCIIGAMVMATAKPQTKVYRAMIQNSNHGIAADSLDRVSQHLQKKFGLTEEQLENIQYANDNVSNDDQWPEKPNSRANVLARRKSVIKQIRSIKVTP